MAWKGATQSLELCYILFYMQAIKHQLFDSSLYRLYSPGAEYLVHRAEYDETEDGFDVDDLKVSSNIIPSIIFICIYFLIQLNREEDEFALSKDVDVQLWIDYRAHNQLPPLELWFGNFVLVNDDLF